jgi:hypothetical protein
MSRSHQASTNLNPTFLAMLREANDGFDSAMRAARRDADMDRAKFLRRIKPRLDERRRKIMVAARKDALRQQMDGIDAAKKWLMQNHPELVPKPKPRAPSPPPAIKALAPPPAPPVSPAPIETVSMSKQQMHRAKPSKLLSEPAIDATTEVYQQIMNKRASIMHLVDLKRAGHSPRHTELSIPSDDSGLRRAWMPPAATLLYGSTSAMCAEL